MHTLIDSIELPTGVRVRYADQGDRDGRPLLLLHGYPDSWRAFEPVLPHLPSSIRAIAPTHRGHGDSSRPSAGYGARDFAADAVALLDALGIGSAMVAGHSMGAAIAQRMALDHPRRVDGLVLIGGATTWANNPVIALLAADVAALTDPVDRAFMYEFQSSTTAQPLDAEFLDLLVDESCKVPARVLDAAMRETILGDFSAELPSIAAPTLLVWGDHDRDISPHSEQDALAAAIPGSELLVYAGAGHSLQWEQPQRFAADVAEFATRF